MSDTSKPAPTEGGPLDTFVTERASHTPSADFPEAVGPTMATRGRSAFLPLIEREDAAPERE